VGFVLLLFTHASLLCYMAVRQANAGDFIQYSRCGIWFHGREGGTSTRIWEKLRFLTGLSWCQTDMDKNICRYLQFSLVEDTVLEQLLNHI